MRDIKEKLNEEFHRQLEKYVKDRGLDEMSYDELYNEIMLNSDDIDSLIIISEAIRFNEKLKDWEKDRLWELIDKLVGENR